MGAIRRVPKIVPYDPDARDADNDGLVQEGTIWERPAGTFIVDAIGNLIREGAPGRTLEDRGNSRIVDKDGKVSLSEFISSPAAEKVASLPKPVSPVRRPVSRRETPVVREQNTAQTNQSQQINPGLQANPQPVYPPQNYPPQTNQTQPVQRPQPNNQNNWNQPVQPTIRSGVSCRSCGIGLDPFWRFCPVCGGENLG